MWRRGSDGFGLCGSEERDGSVQEGVLGKVEERVHRCAAMGDEQGVDCGCGTRVQAGGLIVKCRRSRFS